MKNISTSNEQLWKCQIPVEQEIRQRDNGDGGFTLRESGDKLHDKPQIGTQREKEGRETLGPMIKKQTSRKHDTTQDSLRDWRRTGMPGGIMSSASPAREVTELID